MDQIRGRPFEPGNKHGKGRREGSRNQATVALQQLLDDHGESLIIRGKIMAMQGDPTALKLCWDRLLPTRRSSPVHFKLPKISCAADVGLALDSVLESIASGKLTPPEGEAIARVLEGRRKSIEAVDLDTRLRALERQRQEELARRVPEPDPESKP